MPVHQQSASNYIETIDIAHPPLPANKAEEVLDDMLREVKNSQRFRAFKIVHGKGKTGTVGVMKQVVQVWAYNNRKRILAAIPGEDYGLFESNTQHMRKECGQIADGDLDSANSGMTIIWVK
jgi:hypothetical protein